MQILIENHQFFQAQNDFPFPKNQKKKIVRKKFTGQKWLVP
jgi:hypothetical protein